MEIINASREFTARELYKLTKGQTLNMKDYVGSILTPTAWIVYQETNQTGEAVTVLAIMSSDGEVYSTISSTAKNTFADMLECMGNEPFDIRIESGHSKKGRDYLFFTMI